MNLNVVNNVAEVPTVQRTISAWQQGKPRSDFQSSARTWGELKRELRERGWDTNDVNVTEGNSKLTLVNDDALLPTNIQKGDGFTNNLIIIMTPNQKIKSGADYKALKAEIKSLCQNPKTSAAARSFFGNYTQMSTATMEIKLAQWNKTAVEPKASKVEGINQAMESGKHKVEVKAVDSNQVIKTQLNQALQTIYAGAKLLQNIVDSLSLNDVPSDLELEKLANMLK